MLLNDVLRRLRFALSLDNKATISVFKLAEHDLDEEYLMSMMRKEDEPGFLPCRDNTLRHFLDGLIIKNRGKQEGKATPQQNATGPLNNNEILRKIKIAMSYQQEDMLSILNQGGLPVGKSELTALFRKPDHKHYKACGDQFLRKFLQGMVKNHRPDIRKNPWSSSN